MRATRLIISHLCVTGHLFELGFVLLPQRRRVGRRVLVLRVQLVDHLRTWRVVPAGLKKCRRGGNIVS